MGAWDYGIFDDDTAYDYFDEISEDPRGFFTRSFLQAIDTKRLEYDDAHAVTVSAAYIDNFLNGTQYRNDNHDRTDDTNVNLFGALHPDLDLCDLAPLAVRALKRVIDDQSELNELWAANHELYPKWRGNLEMLMERLGTGTQCSE